MLLHPFFPCLPLIYTLARNLFIRLIQLYLLFQWLKIIDIFLTDLESLSISHSHEYSANNYLVSVCDIIQTTKSQKFPT